MGDLVDWNNGMSSVLAFFPVVAISTNLSTRFKGAKKAKIFKKSKTINHL